MILKINFLINFITKSKARGQTIKKRQDNKSYVTLKCAHIFTIKCVIKTDRVELGRKAEVEDNTTTTMYQERMRVRQRILTS